MFRVDKQNVDSESIMDVVLLSSGILSPTCSVGFEVVGDADCTIIIIRSR